MKRIICLLIAIIMCATLFASCAGTPADTKKTDNSSENGGAASGAAKAFENAKIGDTVTFGSWDQDGKKGGEPISWIVLYQGVGKTFVLSEKILEYQCFKNPTETEKYPQSLYKDSDVRAFLNGEFYNGAFSDDEKAAILNAKITSMYKDEKYFEFSYETEDKVFLLSRDEEARYVCGVGTYIFGYPTERLLNENKYILSTIENVPGVEKATSWWLRDMGTESPKKAAYVYTASYQRRNYDEAVYEKAGVRPAMWVVYNADEMEAYDKGEAQPKENAELNAAIAELKVGSKITFGKYDKNSYNMDGYEDLVWTVIGEDDDSFLLVSDDHIGSNQFKAKSMDGKSPAETSWADSDIRAYINSKATLDIMFSPQEKAKLVLTHVRSTGEDDRDGGAETDDYLFIPDITDLERYSGIMNANIGAKYWLRSQRSWSPYIACVSNSGTVYSSNPTEQCGVRLMARITKK